MLAVNQQAASAAVQVDLTNQATLPQQRGLQFAQMSLHLAVGVEFLHQHIEQPATGQSHLGARVIRLAVAHHRDGVVEQPLGHALQKIVLDAATRQRANPMTAVVDRQHRARRTGRRAVGTEDAAQPHALARAGPGQRAPYHLQVKMLHVSAPCALAEPQP
ncbi:hypothetical protein D3C84_729380 [compost metagenome]